MTVRVRFAPSPTGELHVGGLRTALFNWLFGRHHGGTVILRVEDTDRTRLTPGSMQGILDAQRWLGLDWDEGPEAGGDYGPYFQSERLDLYRAAADRLVAQGDAYRCYCTPERLDAVRAEQTRQGMTPGYDRRCRNLTPEQRAAEEAEGKPYVVRFKMPLEGKTVFHDAIRGEIVFDNARYDDHVLLKSDGFGTYHLAAIVDDGEMQITHAFRGEEWLPSTPRHLLTFRALGYEPPVYAHMPVIVGKDRKKLSKRHGHTSVRSYREQGYLPEAMFNFLGLIGWSLDDHTTIIPREQFIEHFDLDRVVKSPGMFDVDKLNWLNREYLQQLSTDEFIERVMPFLERDLPPESARPLDRGIVAGMWDTPDPKDSVKTRVNKLNEVAPLTAYLFIQGPLEYDPSLLLGRKGDLDPSVVVGRLRLMRDALASLPSWDREAIQELFGTLPRQSGMKLGDLLAPVRSAITGAVTSLPMHVSLALLGRDRALARIDAALDKLRQPVG